jgi:hypothetical protein
MAAGGLYRALMTAGGRPWILIGPSEHRLSLAMLTRLADLLAERHERPNAAPAGALDRKNATCCSEERCRSISGIATMKCCGFRRECLRRRARRRSSRLELQPVSLAAVLSDHVSVNTRGQQPTLQLRRCGRVGRRCAFGRELVRSIH